MSLFATYRGWRMKTVGPFGSAKLRARIASKYRGDSKGSKRGPVELMPRGRGDQANIHGCGCVPLS